MIGCLDAQICCAAMVAVLGVIIILVGYHLIDYLLLLYYNSINILFLISKICNRLLPLNVVGLFLSVLSEGWLHSQTPSWVSLHLIAAYPRSQEGAGPEPG